MARHRWSFALVMLAAGCTDNTGTPARVCPEGEQCSEMTPGGLSFAGTALAEDPLAQAAPLPTALGGTQHIRALVAQDAGASDFTLPFQALSSGDAVGVASVDPPDFVVQGLMEGSAYVRLVEPGTSLLYDRVEVQVAAVDHVDLEPGSYLNAAADSEFAAAPGAWVLFAGGSESCVARLFDAAGDRLVDERLAMSVTGDALAAGALERWDTLAVTGLAAGAGKVAIRTGDGVAHDATVNVTATVDDLVPVAAEGAADDPSVPGTAGKGTTYCFRATSGGTLVAGVPFTFTVDGTGVATTAPQAQNCITVTGETPVAATLTVTAGGVTRDYSLSFNAM